MMTENIKDFAMRVSKDIGWYYTENKSNFNLKKHNTLRRGHMGVFAWINESKKVHNFG